MSTHCSCHCLVITSLVIMSPVAVKEKVGHTQKRSTMAKESSEGEFLKKKVLITTGKGLKIIQGKRCQGKGDSFRSA